MISIEAIGTSLSSVKTSNHDRAEDFGIKADFIRDKLGVETVSRLPEGSDTADLAFDAWRSIEHQVDAGSVRCIVVCTQNPHGNGIPHTSALLHRKIGPGTDCACFDISLGCSGYVYGLSIVLAFMRANGMRRALFFTCDPYSKVVDPDDRNTALLFSDAASVTVLGSDGVLEPCHFRFGTDGQGSQALNNDDGTLVMDGRAVFNFVNRRVPPQVAAVLKDAGLDARDVDRFVFHQGSRFILERLSERIGISKEDVPSNLADHGNTVSSSIPLLLKELLHERSVRNLLLSGFGVGASWATCMLRRSD